VSVAVASEEPRPIAALSPISPEIVAVLLSAIRCYELAWRFNLLRHEEAPGLALSLITAEASDDPRIAAELDFEICRSLAEANLADEACFAARASLAEIGERWRQFFVKNDLPACAALLFGLSQRDASSLGGIDARFRAQLTSALYTRAQQALDRARK
jgi:hypothetical protein